MDGAKLRSLLHKSLHKRAGTNRSPTRPASDATDKDFFDQLIIADLRQKPSNSRIGDGNLVNIAPLQFGKEVARIHGLVLAELLEAGVATQRVPFRIEP